MGTMFKSHEKKNGKSAKLQGQPQIKSSLAAGFLEPTFDANGDPSEETLCAIRNFPICPIVWSYRTLLEFILKAWSNEFWAKETRPGLFVFDCGGCQRNEVLIDALRHSMAFADLKRDALLLWEDGLFIFSISEDAAAEVTEMVQEIEKWAWGC